MYPDGKTCPRVQRRETQAHPKLIRGVLKLAGLIPADIKNVKSPTRPPGLHVSPSPFTCSYFLSLTFRFKIRVHYRHNTAGNYSDPHSFRHETAPRRLRHPSEGVGPNFLRNLAE